MDKKELEKRCKTLEGIIQDIWWMSRRYAHGRQSYAVGMYNDAIQTALDLGMKFKPDNDGLIKAKDRGLDRDWFEKNSIQFITEESQPKLEKNCGAWDDDEGC